MLILSQPQTYQEQSKPPGIFRPVLGETKSNETPELSLKCRCQDSKKQMNIQIFYDCVFMITDSEVFCMNLDTDIFFGYDLDCGEIWFEHRETKDRATFSTTGSDELLNLIEIINRKCPQQNFHQKFSLGQVMGKSKNSKVYLAERKRDGAIFAVKVQKDSSKVEQEISILKQLQHPNLVYLREYFLESEGDVYIVMDYEDGGNLLDRAKSEAFQNYKEKMKFVIDMLNSLQFLRLKGIVHRDIKPENILYSEKDGNYKIGDFGMALKIGEKITKISGTPGYMAPELLENSCQLPQARISSDIYSMGLTFYEIFTKKQYFQGQHEQQILKNNIKAVSFRKRSYHNEENSEIEKKLLEKMIRRKPEDRKNSLEIIKSSTYSKISKLYGVDMQQLLSSEKKPKSSESDGENFIDTVKKLLRIKTT